MGYLSPASAAVSVNVDEHAVLERLGSGVGMDYGGVGWLHQGLLEEDFSRNQVV